MSEHYRVLMTREQIDRDRKAWLAARMQGVGASEVATVLGKDPYNDVETLLRVKAELEAEKDRDDVSAVWWGRELEAPILERIPQLPPTLRYEKRHTFKDDGEVILEASIDYTPLQGVLIEPWGALLQCKREPRLLATPDASQVRQMRPGRVGPVQLKNSALQPFLIKGGALVKRDLYEAYAIQVQAELAVTGLEYGTLAMLCQNTLIYWDIERDEALIEEIFDKVARFWRLVERAKVRAA